MKNKAISTELFCKKEAYGTHLTYNAHNYIGADI